MTQAPCILPQANPDSDPVIYGLAARRSELSGLVAHLEGQLGEAKADLIHIDAVLAMWGVDAPDKTIRAKKATTAGLFHAKELPRRVRGVLKDCAEGATSKEIARRISLDKGWDHDDKRFQSALADKITRLMCEMHRQGRIARTKAKGGVSVWQLAA